MWQINIKTTLCSAIFFRSLCKLKYTTEIRIAAYEVFQSNSVFRAHSFFHASCLLCLFQMAYLQGYLDYIILQVLC